MIRPAGLLLLASLPLLWIYTAGISSFPLAWEEPRRCLVASEMIYRADYVVPRIVGDPYLNKPPLQNWLVVLLAGNRAEAVGPVAVRAISLLSVVGIALCIAGFWRARGGTLSASTPALMFATMGITVQYGRSGEIDPLFSFLVCGALTCFAFGWQRRRPWLQWVPSQLLVALGVLTKGVAPLFFYPPALYAVWRDRRGARSVAGAPEGDDPEGLRPGAVAFGVGLAAAVLVIAAWLVPYTARASLETLAGSVAHEALKPVLNDPGRLARHVVLFPLEILRDALPWSALLGLMLVPAVRERVRANADPWIRLSAWIVICTIVFWSLLPGGRGRYALPGFPFLAILLAYVLECSREALAGVRSPAWITGLTRRARRVSLALWIGAIAGWIAALAIASSIESSADVWQPMAIGAIAIAGLALWLRRDGREAHARLFAGLLIAALLYGVVYTGVTRVVRAQRDRPAVLAAEAFAANVREPIEVVSGPTVRYLVTLLVSQRLGHALEARPSRDAAYYLIERNGSRVPENATLLREGADHALWRVDPR